MDMYKHTQHTIEEKNYGNSMDADTITATRVDTCSNHKSEQTTIISGNQIKGKKKGKQVTIRLYQGTEESDQEARKQLENIFKSLLVERYQKSLTKPIDSGTLATQ